MILGSRISVAHRPSGVGACCLLAVLPLLLSLSGCGGPEPGSLRVVERLIEVPPQRAFRPADLVEDEVVFDWPLRGLGIGADWGVAQEPGAVAIEGAPAKVWMEGNRLSIERPVELDAEGIDRIDVVLVSRKEGATYTGNVVLMWAPPGEAIDESRGLEVPGGEPVGDNLRLYQFPLRREPGWQGAIGRLRIVCVVAERAQIGARRLTGLREVVGAEQLATLRERGLEASLGQQSRNALLALPGLPVEKELELPEGAELRFAVGAQRGVEQRVELAVSVIPEGGAPETLWSSTLVPVGEEDDRGSKTGRWHPVTVALGAWAGQSITLRLEASTQTPLDLRQGFALWAHPEILAPRR